MTTIDEITQRVEESRSSSLEPQNEKQVAYMKNLFFNKPKVTNKFVLSALHLSDEQAEKVRVFDEMTVQGSEWTLQLIHYLDSEDYTVNHIRGIVVASFGNQAKIVCQSFPYTQECVVDDNEGCNGSCEDGTETGAETNDSETNVCQNCIEFPQAVFVNAFEGTILRVFWFEGQWFVSTHKKINGRNSKWASPTFGALFNECLTGDRKTEADYDAIGLNRNLCYVFLLTHPENTLVCDCESPKVYHLMTYDFPNHTSVSLADSKITHDGIAYATAMQFQNEDEVFNYVKEQNYKKYSGVVAIFRGGSMVKFVSRAYVNKRLLRGNEPSVAVRYLQLLQIKNSSYAQELEELCPNKKGAFEKILEEKACLVDYLYHLFFTRHIQGQFFRLPQAEHHFLETICGLNAELKYAGSIDEQVETNVREQIRQHLENVVVRNVYQMIKNHRRAQSTVADEEDATPEA